MLYEFLSRDLEANRCSCFHVIPALSDTSAGRSIDLLKAVVMHACSSCNSISLTKCNRLFTKFTKSLLKAKFSWEFVFHSLPASPSDKQGRHLFHCWPQTLGCEDVQCCMLESACRSFHLSHLSDRSHTQCQPGCPQESPWFLSTTVPLCMGIQERRQSTRLCYNIKTPSITAQLQFYHS